nr:hypothetical protein GCM10010200_034330 [Actinomadura rugatobispora]
MLYRLLRILLRPIGELVRWDRPRTWYCGTRTRCYTDLHGRPRREHADRLWPVALSRLMHRRHWAEIFTVTPGTILRERNYSPSGWRGRTRRGASTAAPRRQ